MVSAESCECGPYRRPDQDVHALQAAATMAETVSPLAFSGLVIPVRALFAGWQALTGAVRALFAG